MRIYPRPIKGHGRDAGLQLLASSVVAAMLGFFEVFFCRLLHTVHYHYRPAAGRNYRD
jgi:hypothetical protein